MHEVAFVEFHESVELAPACTVVGLALRLTVTAGCVTVTVVDRVVVPTELLHASTYIDVLESAPVEVLPEVDLLPLHAPEAAHEVALLEDQESVADPPD